MTNPAGNFYCGVDIGASATKLVLLDADRQVLARAMRHSGVDYRGTARQCLDEARVRGIHPNSRCTGAVTNAWIGVGDELDDYRQG